MKAEDFTDRDAMLAALVSVGKHRVRVDRDEYFLVRQIGLFNLRRDECGCRDNTCGGCTTLTWMIERLEALTADVKARSSAAYTLELAKVGFGAMKGTKAGDQVGMLGEPEDARYP